MGAEGECDGGLAIAIQAGVGEHPAKHRPPIRILPEIRVYQHDIYMVDNHVKMLPATCAAPNSKL